MKKILTILSVIFIISSCSKNEPKVELLGIWNNFPTQGMTEIRLYKDSVISYDNYVKRKGTWRANDSQIKFHYPKKLPGYHVNLTFDYQLKNDSLLIKNEKDTTLIIPPFLKVKNTWKHYLKTIKLQIELPKAEFELKRNDSIYSGINLYVGIENNKMIIKNYWKTLKLKEDLYGLVMSERALRYENKEKYLYFNLITDKNINEKDVDSLKGILKTFPSMKIFRVYENEKANYGKYDYSGQGNLWNWYGRYE